MLLGHAFRAEHFHVRSDAEGLQLPEVFPDPVMLIAHDCLSADAARIRGLVPAISLRKYLLRSDLLT